MLFKFDWFENGIDRQLLPKTKARTSFRDCPLFSILCNRLANHLVREIYTRTPYDTQEVLEKFQSTKNPLVTVKSWSLVKCYVLVRLSPWLDIFYILHDEPSWEAYIVLVTLSSYLFNVICTCANKKTRLSVSISITQVASFLNIVRSFAFVCFRDSKNAGIKSFIASGNNIGKSI